MISFSRKRISFSGNSACISCARITSSLCDDSTNIAAKYIVTIEPKETDVDSPSLLSAKILQTVSIMSSVGIVHTSLLNSAVSSDYTMFAIEAERRRLALSSLAAI